MEKRIYVHKTMHSHMPHMTKKKGHLTHTCKHAHIYTQHTNTLITQYYIKVQDASAHRYIESISHAKKFTHTRAPRAAVLAFRAEPLKKA